MAEREKSCRFHSMEAVTKREAGRKDMQLTDLKAYEILEKRPMKDLNSEGIILRHKKSGAKIAVISNEDENKVFYIV